MIAYADYDWHTFFAAFAVLYSAVVGTGALVLLCAYLWHNIRF